VVRPESLLLSDTLRKLGFKVSIRLGKHYSTPLPFAAGMHLEMPERGDATWFASRNAEKDGNGQAG